MILKTPNSWLNPRWYSYIFSPIGMLWYFLSILRKLLSKKYRSNTPIICIGNHLAGGAGKTPCTIALIHILKSMDKRVVCVSKGYGGKIREATIVNKLIHSYTDVGDEPLLLANHSTTIISKNRISGIKMAESLNADVILLDDGYQNPTFHKDVSVLIVNADTPYNNKILFPIGPSREPLQSAIKRADIIVKIGEIDGLAAIDKPIISSAISAQIKCKPTKNYIAFAGIAYPNKFFNTAEESGFKLIKKIPFADHFSYSKKCLEDLFSDAKALQAKLLTTEKDLVRIPNKFHEEIEIIPIKLQFGDENAITNVLKHKLIKNNHD